MDGSSSKSLPHIVVVASTNRVDGIDLALRWPGLFDSEVEVNVPTAEDRLKILEGIIVLAATNRPHAIDAALLRPGRFNLVLHVPPPVVEGRFEILRIHAQKMKLGKDVDLKHLAKCTDLFTGADLEGLCREAGMSALREDIWADTVLDRHFKTARNSLRPSLTKGKVKEYSFAKFSRLSLNS